MPFYQWCNNFKHKRKKLKKFTTHLIWQTNKISVKLYTIMTLSHSSSRANPHLPNPEGRKNINLDYKEGE
jgi:hypothetical protein